MDRQPTLLTNTLRVVSFLTGVGIAIHDVVFTNLDRPATLGFAAFLVGFPAAQYADRLRQLKRLLDQQPPEGEG